jgi:streptomycin 6-kinase
MDQHRTLPQDLKTHVVEVLGDAGLNWLNGLPDVIRQIENNWYVKVDDPFAAGEFNFVAPAMSSRYGDVVIKIAPPFPDGEFFSEIAYLKHQDGRGCVRVLAEARELRAMMLERAVPGRNLVEEFTGSESESLAPAIECLRRIDCSTPQGVKDVIYLDRWFDGLKRYKGTDFPHSYAEAALGLYETLSAASELRYIHGDFHPGNIVTAERETFLAIDPKGIVGFVGYDIAVFLNNYYRWQESCADVRPRLEHAIGLFADAFRMSNADVEGWCYAVAVLGAWWTFDEMPALYSGGVARADVWNI